MQKIQKIYTTLMNSYGPQGWWPLTPKGSTKTIHHQGPPVTDTHRFEIMLGAILTQNTAWTNVEKALEQLHTNKLVSPNQLLQTNKNKLAKLIRSAGYYNQKAERLKIISNFIKDHTIKTLLSLNKDILRNILLEIKGIGPETADSILLYAFEKPSFVIDTYTKRIFSRIGICEKNIAYDDLQKMFEQNLNKNLTTYQEYHALIVELAKQHCKTKPICNNCPIQRMCEKNV
ncbi:endonuclease III domain-containing protein [Candidatus Woesearchaeota archaeon]|nr:endonuclease III domain-containing protein [Candidatus Woesearchaeota archaeon]